VSEKQSDPLKLHELWVKSLEPLSEDDMRLSRVSFIAGHSARGTTIVELAISLIEALAVVGLIAYCLFLFAPR
jgi:hypothetical protein